MWPFAKKPPPEPRPDPMLNLYAMIAHPPITREQQRWATERLSAPDRIRRVSWMQDGLRCEMDIVEGVVDLRDHQHRDGYHVVFEGYDRYGWPLGHHDSPANSQPKEA